MFVALMVILLSFSVASLGSDPDLDLTTPQIVRRHGYPSESHLVVTQDGYLITMHRIRHGRRCNSTGRVVFLQHGLLASSSDWVLNGPEKSLAYILSDSGYDVWMGNARGNTYSNGHVNLTETDPSYWNFTWHEMAVYDLPAEIDYILELTGQKNLIYIGHSMGTTMFFAMASSKPDYGSKIRGMFALAPVAYMSQIKSPIRILAPWANDIQFLLKYLGNGAFLPNNKILKFLARFGCEAAMLEKDICSNIVFVLCGFDRSQFNMSMLPLILAHSPAGTSTKTVVYYAQEIKNDGKFQRYDFGKSGNLIEYGTVDPPAYNLSAITTPVSLHYAHNDWLAGEADVQHLYRQLPKKLGKHLVPYPEFNHIDFLWGKDVKVLVYDDLLRIIRSLH